MNLTIRIATKSDAVLIADISRITFEETFAAQNSKEDMDKFLKEQFTRDKLVLEAGAPENTYLLCYQKGKIAGYAKLRESPNPQGLDHKQALEIVRFYALAEWIGKGIGRHLMQASIDIAMKRFKKIIWLGVWEKNQRAIDFYTKWNFKKFGEQQFILGNDAQTDWLMKKEL